MMRKHLSTSDISLTELLDGKTSIFGLFTEVRFIVPCEWIGLGGRIFSNVDSPHLCIRMPA